MVVRRGVLATVEGVLGLVRRVDVVVCLFLRVVMVVVEVVGDVAQDLTVLLVGGV